ncbi:MAG: stimulus-sensing domain-containing protein [Alphaproteobacteria bacterium]
MSAPPVARRARDHARVGVRRPPLRAPRRGPLSPLTRRILAINILALGIVVVGLLYLDAYRRGLIESKIAALRTQGELIGGALGESVVTSPAGGVYTIDAEAARQMLRRLVVPIRTRARLFDTGGELVADTRRLPGAAIQVQAEPLPPPKGTLERATEAAYGWVISRLPPREVLEPYVEAEEQRAAHYREAQLALTGESGSALRDGGDVGIILSVAVPVQRFKRIQGALMLSTTIDDVEAGVREVRYAILKLFALGLGVTIALSVFLAGTIARPVRRLAEAADAVRHGQGRVVAIPDFSARGDEIGDLSQALLDMTNSLSERFDAIERFAADVAHEIKNPLTSLRSAVETAARVKEPEQQRKLLAIVLEDVQRLDRLISDISDASRLDAELARAESAPVDVGAMLAALVEVYRATTKPGEPSLSLTAAPDGALVVEGVEQRLVQVFQNLIANARSFSPADREIRLSARRDGDWVEVTVEDDGPGIPAGKLQAIFGRFYSERPAGEKFGTHSGLGLSISKQIVDAHGGVIYAENRGAGDKPVGARIVVRLPV